MLGEQQFRVGVRVGEVGESLELRGGEGTAGQVHLDGGAAGLGHAARLERDRGGAVA